MPDILPLALGIVREALAWAHALTPTDSVVLAVALFVAAIAVDE